MIDRCSEVAGSRPENAVARISVTEHCTAILGVKVAGMALALFLVLSVVGASGLIDGAEPKQPDSLASATALLGRPVMQAWTMIPESLEAFPFGPLFDELRRKIDLRRHCLEVPAAGGILTCSPDLVRWVMDEDCEEARQNDWSASFKLDRSAGGGRQYRSPGILVIGMPGGVAEQTLLTVINHFSVVGWALPRLFFVPLGSMELVETTYMHESLAYDRVFSCFESELTKDVVDYCARLPYGIEQVKQSRATGASWGRNDALQFFKELSASPELIAALSSSITDAWFELSGIRDGLDEMRAALPAPLPYVIPKLFERPTAVMHPLFTETLPGKTTSKSGTFNSVSCCDAQGTFEIVDTDESRDYLFHPPVTIGQWDTVRLRSRPHPGTSSCHLTYAFGIIYRNYDVRSEGRPLL
jgi:hypothetical protein